MKDVKKLLSPNNGNYRSHDQDRHLLTQAAAAAAIWRKEEAATTTGGHVTMNVEITTTDDVMTGGTDGQIDEGTARIVMRRIGIGTRIGSGIGMREKTDGKDEKTVMRDEIGIGGKEEGSTLLFMVYFSF